MRTVETAKEESPCLIWVEKPELSPGWSQNHGKVSCHIQGRKAGRPWDGESGEHASGPNLIFLEMPEPWLLKTIAFHSQRLSLTFPQISCLICTDPGRGPELASWCLMILP